MKDLQHEEQDRWPGEFKCYVQARRILHNMAMAGHASAATGYYSCRYNGKWIQNGKWVQTSAGTCSSDMERLIEALNQGDEEQIKGLLLLPYYSEYDDLPISPAQSM